MSETASKTLGPSGGSYIGPNVRIKGDIKGSETCLIAGKVQGSIDIESEQVVIAPGGEVQADIQASKVSIQGSVRGDVKGSSRVELRKTAVMDGNLTTARIFVEEGAVFRGHIEMPDETKQQPAAAKPQSAPQPRPAQPQPAQIAPVERRQA